ncbi:MAG: hypothetical protein ABI670_17850 [Chloroflexota bacterium]
MRTIQLLDNLEFHVEHTVRAMDEDLVFVGFLHGVPSNISDRVGGLLAHEGAS